MDSTFKLIYVSVNCHIILKYCTDDNFLYLKKINKETSYLCAETIIKTEF